MKGDTRTATPGAIVDPGGTTAPCGGLITLGAAMRLTGAVVRGADLRTAVPRRCVACGALFVRARRERARYCQACRALRCHACSMRGGQHHAECPHEGRPRQCLSCGETFRRARSRSIYCATCREKPRCRTCGGRGRHAPSCDWKNLRPAYARLTVIHNVVSENDILDLYLTAGATAKRIAARVLQPSDAEDCVHDAFEYLLRRRAYLPQVPPRKYLFMQVRSAALKRFAQWWARVVASPTLEELQSAEQMLAGEGPDESD